MERAARHCDKRRHAPTGAATQHGEAPHHQMGGAGKQAGGGAAGQRQRQQGEAAGVWPHGHAPRPSLRQATSDGP